MDNFASDQDELYYTAKNFNKLKFSNTAYIENTTKERKEYQKTIEDLKKEYEKLKSEVADLKSRAIYTAARVKSASGPGETENSEINFYRLKLDQAKRQKLKAREEWKKYDEKFRELKDEAKLITDDSNPYAKRIKLLENKLDKAMIKYNEAMSIRRTYEQILEKLKEERSGYDNQISEIQRSLKIKDHDLDEFKLLLQDSKQARSYSELLVKNTELSKEAFEQHFEMLITAHEKETKNELKQERNEEMRKKTEKVEVFPTVSDDSFSMKNSHNLELERRVREFEEADKLIRETTGADDINEICQKYSNLRETKEKLEKEKRELEKMCDFLNKKKDQLSSELNKLKYQSQDEITRKEIDDHEKNAEKTLYSCEDARQKMKKSQKLNVEIRAGVATIINVLKGKIYDEIFNECKYDIDESHKQTYNEITQGGEGRDLRAVLTKLIDLCGVLHKRYSIGMENYQMYEDMDPKLNRREESEIERIYLNQQIDSNGNSEYGPDDEIDPDIQTKEAGYKNEYKNDLDVVRPFSAGMKKNRRFTVKARDKKVI